MRRRTLLSAGAAIGAAAVGTGLPGRSRRAGAAAPTPEPTDRLLAGTEHETPVYELSGDGSGPTGLVVGGMHGDERSGYLAAERILRWSLDVGRLVVLPRANQVAIGRNSRTGVGGDLNRAFPPGRQPTTELARAIWRLAERTDPDVALNLHSSTGIYGVHAEFVGQAIFPTDVGGAPEAASAVVETLNDDVVPWYMPLHDFSRGNLLSGTAPLFAHKVGADLGRPAHIVELTEYLVDAETGAAWTERAAAELLAEHGVGRAAGPTGRGGGR